MPNAIIQLSVNKLLHRRELAQIGCGHKSIGKVEIIRWVQNTQPEY